MRIAYSTPAQYLLSKVGNIHGAKVLYRVLGPETASADLARCVENQPLVSCSVDDFITEVLCPDIQVSLKHSIYLIH